MAEVELLPIATMIHLILGLMTIILVFRSEKSNDNERFAALVLGWILLILGINYLFSTIIDYQMNNDLMATGQYGSSFLRFGAKSTWIIFSGLLIVLSLTYPYPLIQNSKIVTLGCILTILITLIFIPVGIVTNFEYDSVSSLFLLFPFLIWLGVYLRYLHSEIIDDREEDRTISAVAALLVFAAFGDWLTYWLGIITTQDNHFFARFAVRGSEYGDPNAINLVMGSVLPACVAVSIISIFIGEVWRCRKKGISGVSIFTFSLFVLGILWFIFDYTQMGIVDSCVETQCESFNKVYDTYFIFTSQIIRFLLVPLIFMYLILNFNLIETGGENVWFTRVLVLLMLLIVTSSIIELIQTVLPIPQMITSALFAAAVVVFIGWEERITSGMIRQSSSVSNTLLKSGEVVDFSISRSEYKAYNISVGVSVTLALMISLLISLMGINS